MKITVDTQEVNLLGPTRAVMLGYLRQNPNFGRLYSMVNDMGYSEDALRALLLHLERDGYIKKIYAYPRKNGIGGRKITGVEVLK